MQRIGVFIVVALGGVALSGSAEAACYPVKADVVSLGEKAARFYAQRSLDTGIEEEKRRIEATGGELRPVGKGTLDCKPFPNVLGADEWRCTGAAKVCTKG